MITRNSKPSVSVILPVYNGAKYVAQAIESILTQSFSDFELIAINDGSQDGTIAILEHYAANDSRVHVISRENKGLVQSLNEGLLTARGRYIARMDADDISFPDRLKLQVDYLDRNPDVVLLGVSVVKSLGFTWKFSGLTGKRPSTWGLVFRNNIGHPGVMIRARTLHDNNLFYREEYKHAEDFKLWSELIRYGHADVLPTNLLYYRIHLDSVSMIHRKEQALIDRRIVMENLLERLDIDMQDYFFLDVRSWINQMTDAILSSRQFWQLPCEDRSAVYGAYQEYCAGFGVRTFLHLVKRAGIRQVLSGGRRLPILLYRTMKRQLRKDWMHLEL